MGYGSVEHFNLVTPALLAPRVYKNKQNPWLRPTITFCVFKSLRLLQSLHCFLIHVIGRDNIITALFRRSGFPAGCASYDGPHTIECLRTLWMIAGCLPAGGGYPDFVTGTAVFDEYQSLNLRY